MNRYIAIDNILQELQMKTLPAVTLWNRLEPRSRTNNFDRALKAEVRDALWMLSKQWQMGEFIGDDAGSPIFSKIVMNTTQLTKYVPDGHAVQVFDKEVPLEAQVEQRSIPFTIGTQKIALDIRLQMGRQWLKLISTLGNFKTEFIQQYPVAAPDATTKAGAPVTAHKEAWQQFSAAAGRCMDGAELYFYLKEDPTHHAYDNIPALVGQETAVDVLATKFTEWFEKLYYQPNDAADNAWKPSFLEYQFACSAPQAGNEKVMTANEYYQGHLDWYNLDIDPARETLGDTGVPEPPGTQSSIVSSFLPVPVTFDGMPDTRWWSFEDRRTNFGDINPATTDLGKLLFLEFSLLYANDWFLLPFTLDAGSIAAIKGMSVTNVFGERFWIESAGSGLDDAWNKWTMFTLNKKGDHTREYIDKSLLLLPVTAKILEGDPLEEVHFIRDEMANMVWGIESTIPLSHGGTARGSEAAIEFKNRLQRIINDAIQNGTIVPADEDYKAAIRYEVMNSVPENWIPFIPVHLESDHRSIRLQRAAMPRILQNDPGPLEKVRPRTTLLREGLDQNECEPFFINEEEVTRAGVNVYKSFQQTRWYGGKVFTWLGMRKATGRGEGNSGLAFDQAKEVKKPQG